MEFILKTLLPDSDYKILRRKVTNTQNNLLSVFSYVYSAVLDKICSVQEFRIQLEKYTSCLKGQC